MARAIVIVIAAAAAWLAGFSAYLGAIPRGEDLRPVDAQGDAIVVFTGGGGRIARAMALLREGAGERLLVSGVHHDATKTAIAAHWEGPSRLFDCCVDLDHEARTTIGNAREAARWSARHGAQRIVIVTSDYHMPRALIETRRAAPDITLIPVAAPTGLVNDAGHPASIDGWKTLSGEYAKTIVASLRATLSPRQRPAPAIDATAADALATDAPSPSAP